MRCGPTGLERGLCGQRSRYARTIVQPRPRPRCNVRHLLAIGIAAAIAIVSLAASASAHQPVFLDENDPWPESGPLLLDGTISFAAYGSIDKPGATRGLSFNLQSGQPILVELLIPDQLPETASALPHLTLLDPDGNPTDPATTLGERFDEPFSKTSYRRIAKIEGTAPRNGTWGVVITNSAPSRFTLVVGQRETRGEVQRNDGVGSLATWWSTPPPAVEATIAPVATTTSVQATTPSAPATTTTTTTTTTTLPANVATAPPPAANAPAPDATGRQKKRSVNGSLLAAVAAAVAATSVAVAARRRVIRKDQSAS
jgi:hypothetical protein